MLARTGSPLAVSYPWMCRAPWTRGPRHHGNFISSEPSGPMSSRGTSTRPRGHRTVHNRPFPRFPPRSRDPLSGASPGGVRLLGAVTGHAWPTVLGATDCREPAAGADAVGERTAGPLAEHAATRRAATTTIIRMPYYAADLCCRSRARKLGRPAIHDPLERRFFSRICREVSDVRDQAGRVPIIALRDGLGGPPWPPRVQVLSGQSGPPWPLGWWPERPAWPHRFPSSTLGGQRTASLHSGWPAEPHPSTVDGPRTAPRPVGGPPTGRSRAAAEHGEQPGLPAGALRDWRPLGYRARAAVTVLHACEPGRARIH